MPKLCKTCFKPKKSRLHVCDMVTLSNGRVVNRERVDNYDGDLHDKIGQPDEKGHPLKVVFRHVTPELRTRLERVGEL